MTADLALLVDAAREAGALAVARKAKGLRIKSKAGGSPVTDADLAVDALLHESLRAARPDYGWLSEETADSPDRLERSRLFVVDPIDGTVAFIKNKPWWTVALAVVEDGRPTAAVVYAPDLDELYAAEAGSGATRNGRPIRAADTDSLEDAALLADAKLFQGESWNEPWPAMRFERRNSIAYRLALVGAGAFDAAVAMSPKWDWDVCAGALIAEEAGAVAGDHLGRPFRFNQPLPAQPGLVCAAPRLHPLIVERIKAVPSPE